MPLLIGIHSVREALLNPGVQLESVTLVRGARNQRLREIYRLARQRGIPVHEVPEQAMHALAAGTAHQGVAARTGEFHYSSCEEILEAAVAPGLLLILDGVEDPQNLGAILRTADAAGVSGVFLPERRAAPVTAAAIKASAGAASRVRVSRQANLTRLIEQLQQGGYWVAGLDPAAESPWTEPDYTVPTALVLGGEGRGIRPRVRSHCDFLVRLPMKGQVESLNVSVAAGIILYEVLRQRQVKK